MNRGILVTFLTGAPKRFSSRRREPRMPKASKGTRRVPKKTTIILHIDGLEVPVAVRRANVKNLNQMCIRDRIGAVPNMNKKQKKWLKRILLALAIFFVVMALDEFGVLAAVFGEPGALYASLALYLIPYLIAGHDVLQKALSLIHI